MVNPRAIMQYNNNKIKKALIKLDFHSFYMFPHMRFCKDYHIGDCDFDAFAFKEDTIYFFQFKTNKSCPKKIMEKYEKLEKNYKIRVIWVASKKRKGVFLYDTIHKKGLKID